MVAIGKSRKEIAAYLKTSRSTLDREFGELLKKAKKPTGPPAEPFTDNEKSAAINMASYGITQKEIAGALGCSVSHLLKHLGPDLRSAPTKANANVARGLYRKAVREHNTQAQIFWLKARAGWKDRVEIDGTLGVTGEIEHVHSLDVTGLMRQLSSGGRDALRVVLEEVKAIREAEEPIEVPAIISEAS
jgi:DNA-binding CsgD family transcriptional regulator